MPAPVLVSAANMIKGISNAEAAINISSYTQRFEDPKLYHQDKVGSRVGFAHNYDVNSTCTITGETNTATLPVILGAAFGVAEVVANSIVGFGVATGGNYMDDIEISQERDGWSTATANFTKLPDIT